MTNTLSDRAAASACAGVLADSRSIFRKSPDSEVQAEQRAGAGSVLSLVVTARRRHKHV